MYGPTLVTNVFHLPSQKPLGKGQLRVGHCRTIIQLPNGIREDVTRIATEGNFQDGSSLQAPETRSIPRQGPLIKHTPPPSCPVTSLQKKLRRRLLRMQKPQGQPTQVKTSTGAGREKFYFQFISTPTADTPGTTLLLHFDSKRYIFGNVSEGTQRACVERGVGPRKIRNIFISGRTTWHNTGGLIGMILTLAESRRAERDTVKQHLASVAVSSGGYERTNGAAEELVLPLEDEALMVHGGDHLLHTLACARRFVFRQSMHVDVNEIEFSEATTSDEPTWSDDKVRIWAMSIPPSDSILSSNDSKHREAMVSNNQTNTTIDRAKRNHDEFSQETETRSEAQPVGQHQHQESRELKHSIVSNMFNSDWHRNDMIETPLAQVQMPAAIFVRDPTTREVTPYEGPQPGDGTPLPELNVLVRKPWPGANTVSLPPIHNLGFQPAVSYIVKGHPQRGRFDPAKAIALGIPRGQLYSRLAAGESVTLENGRTIRPDMVLGPTKPGRGIAIVDLPTIDYVKNLVERTEWTMPAVKDDIKAICWILGPNVVFSDELYKFMATRPHVKHIISSTDICSNYLALDSCAALSVRLARLCRSYFPIPVHDDTLLSQDERTGSDSALDLANCAGATRGLKLEIEPEFIINSHEVQAPLDIALIARKLSQRIQQCASEAQQKVASRAPIPEFLDDSSNDGGNGFDPEIIALGTGSAAPSKYRNVSATLLRTGKYGNFLFDCGEGTLGQLRRVFKPAALQDVLRNLNFIWISHLHADHHLGLLSVLGAHKAAVAGQVKPMEQDRGSPRTVSAPSLVLASEGKMLRFVAEYESIETFPNVRRLFCEPPNGPRLDTSLSILLREQLGLSRLQSTRVNHCHGAQAVSVTFQNGFKFSYSGDCRPSTAFAGIGKGSDVLVHEATFDDDMKADAKAKKHCTTQEALRVAAMMEAKNVILTHFSQRYQKLPVLEDMERESSCLDAAGTAADASQSVNICLDESAATDPKTLQGSENNGAPNESPAVNDVRAGPSPQMNVAVAFDYMRIRVSQIKDQQHFKETLSALFEGEDGSDKILDDDEKATAPKRNGAINYAGSGPSSSKKKSDKPLTDETSSSVQDATIITTGDPAASSHS